MNYTLALDLIQLFGEHTRRNPDEIHRKEVWNVLIQNALYITLMLGQELNSPHRIKEARESDAYFVSEDAIFFDSICKQLVLYANRSNRHIAKTIRTKMLKTADLLAKTIGKIPPSRLDEIRDEGDF